MTAIKQHYRIIKPIGKGGMGRVLLAIDQHDRYVAIKVVHAELAQNPEIIQRFEREVRVQRSLQHPNVLPIMDAGLLDDLPCFVMPYVDGQSLSQRLRQGALAEKQAAAILWEIISALSAAHQRRILHRDIKPGNILLAQNNHCYLTDFGIATDPNPQPVFMTRTALQSDIGTVGYIAPEIQQGYKATVRSDIYSLGVTYYEMLTSQPYAVAILQGSDPYQGLSAASAAVIKRATQQAPSQRYASVVDLAKDYTERSQSAAISTHPFKPTRAAVQPDAAPSTAGSSPGSTPPAAQTGTASYHPPPQAQRQDSSQMWVIGLLLGILVLFVFGVLMLAGSPQTGSDTFAAIGITQAPLTRPIVTVTQRVATAVILPPPATITPTNVPPPSPTAFVFVPPTMQTSLYNQGVTACQRGDYLQGILHLSQHLQAQPGDAVAYVERARCYYEQQDFNNALIDIRSANQIDPNYAEIYLLLGDIYYHVLPIQPDKRDDALAAYTDYIQLNRSQVPAYVYDRIRQLSP